MINGGATITTTEDFHANMVFHQIQRAKFVQFFLLCLFFLEFRVEDGMVKYHGVFVLFFLCLHFFYFGLGLSFFFFCILLLVACNRRKFFFSPSIPSFLCVSDLERVLSYLKM